MEEKGSVKINIKAVGTVIAVIIVLFILVRLYHSFFSAEGGSLIGETISSIGYEQGDKADFYTTDDGIYFVTKDGVIFMNKKGSAIEWQDTYTMMAPIVQGDEDIIGVAEGGGSVFAVYNTGGNLYKVNADANIISFAVNKKGASALITATDREYTINAYTESGFASFMAKNPIEDGMPVGCDISDDGRFLAIAYVYTGYTELETRIVFYNLKEEADTAAADEEQMVASFIRSGQVMGIIRFMNGNNLIGLSDSELVSVKLSVDGQNVNCSENWSKKLTNSVSAMTLIDKNRFALGFGEKNLNHEDAKEENTVVIYNLKGKELFSTVEDKHIDGMYAGHDTVIVQMGRTFDAYSVRGAKVLAHTVSQDVNKLLLYDGNDKALIVASKEAFVTEVKSRGISGVISDIKNKTEESSEKNADEKDSKSEEETPAELQTDVTEAPVGTEEVTAEENTSEAAEVSTEGE